MTTLQKINKFLRDNKIYIKKHFYNYNCEFVRVKRVTTKKDGSRVDIHLLYDANGIKNIHHGYLFGEKREKGLLYLLRTLEDIKREPNGLFYCGHGLDTLTIKN